MVMLGADQDFLNVTFTIPKCLKYRNKGKGHNSQTQQYFIKFLKYINNNMDYMFTALWDLQRLQCKRCRSHNAVNVCISGSTS